MNYSQQASQPASKRKINNQMKIPKFLVNICLTVMCNKIAVTSSFLFCSSLFASLPLSLVPFISLRMNHGFRLLFFMLRFSLIDSISFFHLFRWTGFLSFAQIASNFGRKITATCIWCWFLIAGPSLNVEIQCIFVIKTNRPDCALILCFSSFLFGFFFVQHWIVNLWKCWSFFFLYQLALFSRLYFSRF